MAIYTQQWPDYLRVLGVVVKRQAGRKQKHNACTSKHFVSVSKMSKVREAMTVLTTQYMFLQKGIMQPGHSAVSPTTTVPHWLQLHTVSAQAASNIDTTIRQAMQITIKSHAVPPVGSYMKLFLLCLCVMGVSVQYEAYQLLKVLLVPFLLVCSGPMIFFPQCQYYWVQHDEQISGFQVCIHAHRTLAETCTGKILVKMWFIQ